MLAIVRNDASPLPRLGQTEGRKRASGRKYNAFFSMARRRNNDNITSTKMQS